MATDRVVVDMGTTLILQNGRIIDPANNRDETGDLWIRDGKIVAPEDQLPTDARCYDLQGKWVVPGLIDMHVHLRDPGHEYKESIESGTRAAAAGGFTAVACMPNTKPVNDTASITRYIRDTAASCDARVYPIAAVSVGSKGSGLAEYGELKEAGAVALSDDGVPVVSSQLMRRALEYADSHDMLVISHSEEPSLCHGSMNEGAVSTRLGLKGIPTAAESIMVYREIALAEFTGLRVHIAHVSSEASVDLIRHAKKRGVRVTAETAPHYFSLTDEAVLGYNTNAKMNPPLRGHNDMAAVQQGLQDGTFDAIATDHAPHSVLEKEVEFDMAANGIIGLETSVGLTLALVRAGTISPTRMVELMSTGPAAILGVAGGTLATGVDADVTVIDPEKEYKYTKESVVSKSTNSPFLGTRLQGKAVLTLLAGRITHDELG